MKLEMNRAWNDAMRLIKSAREVVAIVAGVFFFLPYFTFMIMMPDPLQSIGMAEPQDFDAATAKMYGFYTHNWWMFVVIGIIQAAGMLGLLALLTDQRRPTLAEALRIGASKVLPYIAAYLLVGLAMGMILLFFLTIAAISGVPALSATVIFAGLAAWLLIFVRMALVAPVLVKEDVSNPLTALGRSWNLTSGNGGRLLVFFVLMFLAFVVMTIVASIVFGLLFTLFGPQSGQFGDALVVSVMNAGWATVFLAVLSALHDQFAGPSTASLNETFE